MKAQQFLAAVLLTALFFPTGARSEDSPKAGDVRLEKRKYKTWSGKTGEYEVGTFFVKENRSEPDSRIISIGFSRFRAEKPTSPPVFFLPGGPGNSFLERGNDPQLRRTPFYIEYLWDKCDVILVDQRGYSRRGEVLTGYFKGREPKPDQTLDDRVAEYKHIAKSITKYYATTKTDLRGYTVLECVEDVNELRQALGYEKISLRGQSFGCQWSFAFHAESIRKLVERALLSGIEPLDHTYDMPSHIFAAVKRIWKIDRCRSSVLLPTCRKEAWRKPLRTVIKTARERNRSKFRARKHFLASGLRPSCRPWDRTIFRGTSRTRSLSFSTGRCSGGADRASECGAQECSFTRSSTRAWESLPNDENRLRGRSGRAISVAKETLHSCSPRRTSGRRRMSVTSSENPLAVRSRSFFVNGDWGPQGRQSRNMLEIAPYFPNSHSLTVHHAGHGTITGTIVPRASQSAAAADGRFCWPARWLTFPTRSPSNPASIRRSSILRNRIQTGK